MKTSIAHKLVMTGLTPTSDVVELWYPNGEFALTHRLQKTADEKRQVEFNVYQFSDRVPYYNGMLKVVRAGRTYTSPILEFEWEDVYHFSLLKNFSETLIAALVSVLIIIIPTALLLIYRRMHSGHKAS
jgi:hypothetical protein